MVSTEGSSTLLAKNPKHGENIEMENLKNLSVRIYHFKLDDNKHSVLDQTEEERRKLPFYQFHPTP